MMGAKHKNKRTGVTHERPRPGWTNAEIDFVLNKILPLDDPKKLHAEECRIAAMLDRGRELKQRHRDYGKGHSRKPIDLLIWKLASGYGRQGGHGAAARYVPDYSVRKARAGLSFTWMEKRIIQIAFGPGNDGQTIQTPDRIAIILMRPRDEILSARVSCLYKQKTSGGFGL